MLQPNFEGLGVVVMDALLNRPWWEEEEFARLLRLPMRPVRQVLRLLETVKSPSLQQSSGRLQLHFLVGKNPSSRRRLGRRHRSLTAIKLVGMFPSMWLLSRVNKHFFVQEIS